MNFRNLWQSLVVPTLLLGGCAPVDGPNGTTDEPLTAANAPVYLNHSFGVLSHATITAFQTDAWLADRFVDVEVRTTVRPDVTYTGTYFNTRETYLEFFGDGDFFGYPAGNIGLGLGDEVTGGVQAVRQDWLGAFGAGQAYAVSLTSHDVNNVSTPWFYQTSPKWADTSAWVSIWDMQYVPDAGSTTPRTRHEERALRYDPTKLAQNVQGLVYALPAGDRANLRTTLQAVGWSVSSLGTGSYLALSPWDHGTRREIVVQPSTTTSIGLIAVVWKLNRVEVHTETLGDATLESGILGRPYAVLWTSATAAADANAAQAVAAATAD